MSAFIVSRYHVASLVQWYKDSRSNYDHDRSSEDYRERCSDLLMAQNVRSVEARYPTFPKDELPGPIDESEAPFTHEDFRRLHGLNPLDVVKGCHCLAYQSCETDDWNETPAKALLDRIEACAVRSLPGYDHAQWSIDRPVRGMRLVQS